jgi:hypothetical protein
LLGGLGASVAILAANQAGRAAGLTELDLPRVLGLSFRGPREAGVREAGILWFLASGGVLVPTLYWLGLRGLNRAGSRAGVVLGAVHYVASGLLLAFTDPEQPKDRGGTGRPMGAFLTRYGLVEQMTNLVGHLAYGAVVGAAAGRPARG